MQFTPKMYAIRTIFEDETNECHRQNWQIMPHPDFFFVFCFFVIFCFLLYSVNIYLVETRVMIEGDTEFIVQRSVTNAGLVK